MDWGNKTGFKPQIPQKGRRRTVCFITLAIKNVFCFIPGSPAGIRQTKGRLSLCSALKQENIYIPAFEKIIIMAMCRDARKNEYIFLKRGV